MAERYTNIRIIADKLLRNPLMSDITFETIVDHTIDFIRIVGVPIIFEDKIEDVKINNYRGKLPCDWYETIQMKYSDTCNSNMLRATSDTFHLEQARTEGHSSDPTFMIQGEYIFTSFRKGDLVLSYRAIATDESGFPKLPDNSNFTRALESYIKRAHYSILFDLGKISQAVYQKTDQEYAWNVGSYIGDSNMLDLSEAESFFNSYSTLIIRANEFKHGFVNNGAKELLRRH